MLKKFKNSIRRQRLVKAGVGVSIDCPMALYGDGEGVWAASPEGLEAGSVVYSFGIGRDLSFDLAMVERHGAEVHAFDPTPASVAWVHEQNLPEGLTFHELGLADYDGDLEFFPPRKATSSHFTPVLRYKNSAAESFKAPVRKLGTIAKQLGHDHIDLLKIDIEGGEYGVIPEIVAGSIPIHQLLIEFHHSYETIPFQKTVDAVTRLKKVGFEVFAISERTYEMSMIRRP
jgi:FkbM family methyltransferase